mmetsp:Transcript_21152/g.46626  ORF Transcript_21152/g.46626 Transcript_21152/m.46626 type:complete len:226 (-) Transcript_21152:959-1636(-)
MLQGCDKFMVNALGFIISLLSCFLLPQEALHLPFGVVQLGVRIANFLRIDKKLKSLCQARLAPMPFRQWAHDLWMFSDEAWTHNVILDVVAAKLVKQTRCRTRRRTLQLQLGDQVIQLLECLWVIKISPQFHATLLLNLFNHGNARPGRCKIYFHWRTVRSVWVVLDLVAALNVQNHCTEELFRHVHQIIVVRICHVELACGEFRIVRQINALIAEVAADLKHSV